MGLGSGSARSSYLLDVSNPQDPARRVLVYGLQRSGTTWISSIIDHVEGARCVEEIFIEDPVLPGSYLAEAPAILPWWRRTFQPVRSRVEFMASVLSPTPEHSIVGAKLMYPQIGWPIRLTGRLGRRWPQAASVFWMRSLRRWIIENDVVVLVVERRNVLKLRISELMAQRTGIMHSTEGDRPEGGVRMEPTAIVNRLERTQRRQAAARRFVEGCTTFEIFYEDSDETKREVLSAALGVDDVGQLQSRYQKVTSDDPKISLTNYDEVADALRGSRFEWCLGESV